MPPRSGERIRLEEGLLLGHREADVLGLARELGVSYLVVTPRLLASYADAPRRAELDARPYLERVFLWEGPEKDFVGIYRIRGAGR
jgi:hypothetical protein